MNKGLRLPFMPSIIRSAFSFVRNKDLMNKGLRLFSWRPPIKQCLAFSKK
jgi:hypothetical protein